MNDFDDLYIIKKYQVFSNGTKINNKHPINIFENSRDNLIYGLEYS